MNIKKEIDRFIVKIDTGEDYYLLDDIKNKFEHKMSGRNLMIFHNEEDWISFAFFKWQSGESVNGKDECINNQGELYWYGCGPSGYLRELRHSYLNEYIFYLDTDFMIICCNELKAYFD